MAQYWMSWESGQVRRRRPSPSRRTLISLGLILLALLGLLLLVLLVYLGHEHRSGNMSIGGMTRPAVATHSAYVFMVPDFVPGAEAAGVPDLFRGTWDFMWGCSVIIRLLVLGALPVAIAIAYQRGLRKGREEG